MTLRLASPERRQSIVDAAVPLFARKGFAGTTTREIAEAAGVSEALVFKYFASKTALYEAILLECDGLDPNFNGLQQLPPGTDGLVALVVLFADRFTDPEAPGDPQRARYRLFLRSLLEDGEFARAGLRALADSSLPIFTARFEGARHAGDLIAEALSAQAAFWFAVQNALMLGSLALSNADTMMNGFGKSDMVRASLRGIGLREDVIAAHRHQIEIAARPESTAAIA